MARRRLGGRALGCLTASLLLLAGCQGTAKHDQSYFTIRPVRRQSAPPCAPPALSELQADQAVRCYELGASAVDAADVTSAAVVANPATGVDEVTFQLSPDGTGRFNAMAQAVGRGGQAAIVVDKVVVSAPRFDTTDFPGTGVITGLDTATSHQLATRLNRK